jgi:acetone carboxylase alpha subunit
VNYKHRATETNLEEIIEARESIPRGDDYDLKNPDIAELRGKVELGIPGDHAPCEMKEYGLYEHHWLGGGGLGDPLDRSPDKVANDLSLHHTNPWTAKRTYGVEAEYNEERDKWIVDSEKTEELRNRIRKERIEKAVSFEEWRNSERKRIVEKRFQPIVTEMYRDIMSVSAKFSINFREFWNLPDDFDFSQEGQQH